ncbi:MAG TPA: type II secretion system protein [Tepidisphaeraceae bacterium]|nr:type II secretion system protein [Tepidisphaeraceae bacterium]
MGGFGTYLIGGSDRRKERRVRSPAFTLVELLVVMGIIAMLVSILLPALAGAQKQAKSVQCKSNLRNLGLILYQYVNENKGWLFPVGPDGPDGRPTTYGTNKPPNERWPMHVSQFKINVPNPMPFNPALYDPSAYDPDHFPVAPFTPPILVCPIDENPWEAHSYVLNQHLADKRIKLGSKNFGGISSSEVVVAGEKRNSQRDYYMERAEFDRIVEKYQHGVKLGSNYLFHDCHVDTVTPNTALTGMDPWDPKLPDVTTTQPGH